VTTLPEYLDRTDVTTPVGTTPIPGLRDYLGATAAEDAVLVAWYGAAIDWCDQKISSRDFVDSAGADIDPPDATVIGVYEFVRVIRDYAARGSVGVKRVKTGAREEEYFEAGTAGRVTQAGIAAWPYLEPYVEDPTLFASGGA
jgi:hypothetical protein